MDLIKVLTIGLITLGLIIPSVLISNNDNISDVLGTVLKEYNSDEGVKLQLVDLDNDCREEVVIENDFIFLVISPHNGASITEIRYKNATSFPIIEEYGANIVGTGNYFIDVARSGNKEGFVSLCDTEFSFEILEKTSEIVKVKFLTESDLVFKDCKIERIITVNRNDSSFSITKNYYNSGNQPAMLEIGSRFEQKSEGWRKNIRLYIGSDKNHEELTSMFKKIEYQNNLSYENVDNVQWQMISQYGLSITAKTILHEEDIEFFVHFSKAPLTSCDAHWIGGGINIEPNSRISYETDVLICEGMPEIGDFGEGGVSVSTYLQSSADPGDVIPIFGTVVSSVKKDVGILFQSYFANETSVTIESCNVTLEPGKAMEVHSEVEPLEKGLLTIECTVMENKIKLASDKTIVFIDDGLGGNTDEFERIRASYTKKTPEHHYNGTWIEIGKKFVEDERIKQEDIDIENIEFYKEYFPYYADLLNGANEELNLLSEQNEPQLDFNKSIADEMGCISLFFNGPDGPIACYSKERKSVSMNGLEIYRYQPTEGYECYIFNGDGGFNEEGLFIAGAAINCDEETKEIGDKLTEQWLADGKHLSPNGLMLLSTCATVEEAVSYIENENAPLSSTSNLLIVDKEGNAAVVQSSGILNMIRMYSGPADHLDPDVSVFSASNYVHPDENELFSPGALWDLHINSLLREWRVDQFIKELNGNVTLKDVFCIMRSQSQPGGICQLLVDNVANYKTVMSVIAHIKTGDLYISYGDPANVHYELYTFD